MLAHLANAARRRVAAVAGTEPWLAVETGPGAGLRLRGRNASADYVTGAIESPVQDALLAHLAPGDVFFDVGSNVGFFALVAARLVGPAGTVVAFEPVVENVACLRANVARNRRTEVVVWPTAVGARGGAATLFVADHPGGSSLAAGEAPDVVATREVEVVAIDELVASGAVPAPSFVKIDVEGAEADVFEGMAGTVATAAPVVLYEVDDTSQEQLEVKAARLQAWFRVRGYDVRTLPASYEGSGWHVRHELATPVTGRGR